MTGVQTWALPISIIETGTPGRAETHLRSTGFSVTRDSIRELMTVATTVVGPDDWVCVSGSLPDGASMDDFIDICRLLKERAAGLAIDASGAALVAAVRLKPDIASPNAEELLSLQLAPGIDESLAALAEAGIRIPVCTLGPSGAVCWVGGRRITAPSPAVNIASAVGAGDAFLAGFVVSVANGADVSVALRFAVRCGASAATFPTAGRIDANFVRAAEPVV